MCKWPVHIPRNSSPANHAQGQFPYLTSIAFRANCSMHSRRNGQAKYAHINYFNGAVTVNAATRVRSVPSGMQNTYLPDKNPAWFSSHECHSLLSVQFARSRALAFTRNTQSLRKHGCLALAKNEIN